MVYGDGPTFDGMGSIISGNLSKVSQQYKKRISELEQELAEARQEIERCHAVMKVTCPSIEDLKQERDRLQSMVDAQVAELNAISEALGTYDGHSSVTHINILRERLAALEGK